MIKRLSKSYKSDNRGSAIITGLVVSTVLMVLCLSLLLVSYSLFLSESNTSIDFANRELVYSAAEVFEHELTLDSLDVTDLNPSNMTKNNIREYIFSAIKSESWSAYNGGDIEAYSKYFNISYPGSSKVVVQLYWENAENSTDENGAVLNAIYRVYNGKGEVLVKAEKKYKLTIDKTTSLSGGENGGNVINNLLVLDTPDITNSDGSWTYIIDNARITFYDQTNSQSNARIEIRSSDGKVIKDWEYEVYLDGVSNIYLWNNGLYSAEKLSDGWYRIKSNSASNISNFYAVDFNCSGVLKSYPQIRVKVSQDYQSQSGNLYQTIEQETNLQYNGFSFPDWASVYSFRNEITFENNLNRDVDNWTMEFYYTAQINNFENANIIESGNGYYKIKDKGKNGFSSLKPGETFKVIFSGNGEGFDEAPTGIKIYTIEEIIVNGESTSTITWKWNRISDIPIITGGDEG